MGLSTFSFTKLPNGDIIIMVLLNFKYFNKPCFKKNRIIEYLRYTDIDPD